MIILKTELNKEDYEFFSTQLKIFIQQRESKNKTSLKNSDKSFQEKIYEKFIIPLAEKGQVESMQMYCEMLPPISTMNSKIVSNFLKLEAKSVKSPREFMALYAYYNWYTNYYKYTYNSVDEKNLDVYNKAKENYNKSFQNLFQIGKTDPLASEQAFILRKKNLELLTREEYLRTMSNFRNQIYATANHQINEDTRLKLLLGYCNNLIQYSSDNEYANRQPLLTTVIASLQKKMILLDEMRR